MDQEIDDDGFPANEYTKDEEREDNYLSEQRDAWDDEMGGNYPQAKKSESLFSLFKDVWKTNDSSKVANLEKSELGDLGLSVRDCQEIALTAELLHHKIFADYFSNIAEVTLATSMSKRGWFVELFVTSKKFAHKGVLGNTNQQQQKWRIFGAKAQTATESQQQ